MVQARNAARQPADQRYDNAYLFGTICPARGVGASLALPDTDTEAMQLHLDENSRHVAEGAHAVLLPDRTGWHTTSHLDMPKNITPIFLPSRARIKPCRVFSDNSIRSESPTAMAMRRRLSPAPTTISAIGCVTGGRPPGGHRGSDPRPALTVGCRSLRRGFPVARDTRTRSGRDGFVRPPRALTSVGAPPPRRFFRRSSLGLHLRFRPAPAVAL